MHEILHELPPNSFVLDLGCASGSFSAAATQAFSVRLDRSPGNIRDAAGSHVVQADAASLPFRSATFHAVVSNHSLEHFTELDRSLEEIGRVLRREGASLFVSVPDASTFTDRLYRWLARGGGHVNAFICAEDLGETIQQATGLPHVRTRTLYSSLSFLNRRNAPGPLPRRWRLLGGGREWSLFLYNYLSRRLDRLLGTRIAVYGWAFYFGQIADPISSSPAVNVCLRCGSGHPSAMLRRSLTARFKVQTYLCPDCGALNPFCEDFEVK